MKRLAIIIVALGALLTGCKNRNAAPATETAPMVEMVEAAAPVAVPDFSVEMLDGSTVNMASLRGKTVLLTFWATWCPPCNKEMSHVQSAVIDRFAGEEFVFLPISRGEEKATVQKWFDENGYKFTSGLDPDGSIFNIFAESGIPLNILIDPQGNVVERVLGYDEESHSRLTDKVAETIAAAKGE